MELEDYNMDLIYEPVLKNNNNRYYLLDNTDDELYQRIIPSKELSPKELPPKELPPKELPPKVLPPKELPPKVLPPKELPSIIPQIDTNKMMKYGDDSKHEPWMDINVFFPIADKMVDPLHSKGLTPNMITIIGTLITIISVYFLSIGHNVLAFFSYIFGYILDCVDGRLARKHNMKSDIGMALDMVTDVLSNIIIFGYLLLATRFKSNYLLIGLSVVMLFMLSVSMGVNEAMTSYDETGSDDFSKRKKKQLERSDNILNQIYLFLVESSYKTYRLLFPEYDEKSLNHWLKVLKHFGPGNFCLYVGLILLFI